MGDGTGFAYDEPQGGPTSFLSFFHPGRDAAAALTPPPARTTDRLRSAPTHKESPAFELSPQPGKNHPTLQSAQPGTRHRNPPHSSIPSAKMAQTPHYRKSLPPGIARTIAPNSITPQRGITPQARQSRYPDPPPSRRQTITSGWARLSGARCRPAPTEKYQPRTERPSPAQPPRMNQEAQP